MLALLFNKADIVRVLLAAGAKTDKKQKILNCTGSLLHLAACCVSVDVIQELVATGLNPKELDSEGRSVCFYASGNTVDQKALMWAVDAGADILALGVNRGWGGDYAISPLHFYAEKGHVDLVDRVLASGVDINMLSKDQTALDQAVARGDLKMTEALLERGAKNPSTNPILLKVDRFRPSLHTSAKDLLNLLLKYKVDVNASNSQGVTALHHHFKWPDYLEALVEAGALVDAKDEDGWTPLHLAVVMRDTKAIKSLLAHGADPTIKTKAAKKVDGKYFGKGYKALDLANNVNLAETTKEHIKISAQKHAAKAKAASAGKETKKSAKKPTADRKRDADDDEDDDAAEVGEAAEEDATKPQKGRGSKKLKAAPKETAAAKKKSAAKPAAKPKKMPAKAKGKERK
eukprot:m.127424 g.127424  ORF g.127424 m.127424 type:complete len:403 (-) comp19855_c0_seq1:51-1259(-)